MEEEEESEDSPKISLHAITRRDALDTMKVYGQIGRSISLVLIDLGSTHNFMSLALAEVLELIPKRGEAMEVIVALGEKIQSLGKCNLIVVELQRWNFHIEFFVLPLEGYGIVLGAQWLRILGPIWWDFGGIEDEVQLGRKACDTTWGPCYRKFYKRITRHPLHQE